MPDLLVSFCNVRRAKKNLRDPAFLAVARPHEGELEPVARDLLKMERSGGVTGICRHGDGFACIVQNSPNSRLCLLDSDLAVTDDYYLGGVTRAHSLTSRGSELFVVSTGTDSVVRWTPDQGTEVIWRLTGDKTYTAHMNSIVDHRGQLHVSGFGAIARETSSHQTGWVINIENEDRLITGITQPHSLLSTGDHFMLVESGASAVIDSNGARLQFPGGYMRGLARTEDELFVGRSRRRHVKKQGGGADPPAVLALDRERAEQGEIEINSTVKVNRHTREIYDILLL